VTPGRMKKLLSCIAIPALLSCGCAPAEAKPGVAAAGSAPVAPPSAPREPARPGLLGVVLAGEQVDVAARYEGRLEAVHCRLGDRVLKDSLLATVDTRALRREMAMAEAELRVARGELERAKLDVAETHERFERRKAEYAERMIPIEDFKAAEFRAKQAAGPGLQIAEAHVAERGARVEQLKQQLLDAEVRAPFDGTVAVRYVDSGAAVTRGSPIVRLVASAGLRIRFAIPEERAGELSEGTRVKIKVEGFDEPYPGLVEKIAPEVEAASRTILGEAKFSQVTPGFGDGSILAGRVVRVTKDVSRP
jgi:RND family efflux transporter MFP subunit